MKKVSILIMIGAIAFLLFYNGSSKKIEYIAKAKLIKGKVYIKSKSGKKEKRLKINQKIPYNSIIRTTRNSSAILFLRGGTLIEIKGKSKLILNKSFINKEIIPVSVIKGRVRFKIKKLLKNQKFNVYTPTAVAGVRGTDFDIQIADDGSLGINVEDGAVELKNNNSDKILKKNNNAEVSVDKEYIKTGKGEKNLDEWTLIKENEIRKQPVKKVVAIKKELEDTEKSQKDLLNALKKKEKKKSLLNKEDTLFFNETKTDGLFFAALNIKNKSKNKKVARLYKEIERIHNTLDKLNKEVEEKFKKLDEYYKETSKELDEKFNNFGNDFEKNFDD